MVAFQSEKIYFLSKNFSLDEFKVSKQYPDLAKGMVLSCEDMLALKVLCLECLQPIRDKFGPIQVLSGFRSKQLNDWVGGSSTSDHRSGNASDIASQNVSAESMFKWIVNESDLPYRQVIYYPDQQFVHISNNHPMKPKKHEALVAVDSTYVKHEFYFS